MNYRYVQYLIVVNKSKLTYLLTYLKRGQNITQHQGLSGGFFLLWVNCLERGIVCQAWESFLARTVDTRTYPS